MGHPVHVLTLLGRQRAQLELAVQATQAWRRLVIELLFEEMAKPWGQTWHSELVLQEVSSTQESPERV